MDILETIKALKRGEKIVCIEGSSPYKDYFYADEKGDIKNANGNDGMMRIRNINKNSWELYKGELYKEKNKELELDGKKLTIIKGCYAQLKYGDCESCMNSDICKKYQKDPCEDYCEHWSEEDVEKAYKTFTKGE